MSESAIDLKRQLVADAITRCAQQLADEHGLDGFTMDQLAECAGVSRRTLFNYVPGKLDAVLGSMQEPDPEVFSEFLAGGPTGVLIEDIKAVIATALDRKDTNSADLERVRRLIASDARIHKAARDRFERIIAYFAEAISSREGETFDPARARIVATITLSLFEIALDDFAADPGTELADHFNVVFDTAKSIFN